MRLEIVYLPPGDLTPYEKNTRKHSPDDIEQIKESIRQDGFSDPIGIWGKQNIIVEGHGRQIAALEMGLDEVPCIRLDHMTDEQRRDYAIRHNATGLLSGWDFDTLREEVARLEIEGHNFDGLRLELDQMGGLATPIENTSREYGEEDFGDDKFECECPRCGFKFNK